MSTLTLSRRDSPPPSTQSIWECSTRKMRDLRRARSLFHAWTSPRHVPASVASAYTCLITFRQACTRTKKKKKSACKPTSCTSISESSRSRTADECYCIQTRWPCHLLFVMLPDLSRPGELRERKANVHVSVKINERIVLFFISLFFHGFHREASGSGLWGRATEHRRRGNIVHAILSDNITEAKINK